MAKDKEAAPNPLQQLEAAMTDGFSDEATHGTASVPASPINLVDAQTLGEIVQGTPLRQTGNKGVSPAKILSHYSKDQYNNIKDAINAEEKHLAKPSNYRHNGYEVQMPGSVREVPNRLYFRVDGFGNLIKMREKGDRLLTVLFGDEAKRVFEVCNRSGFVEKPLVFVAQCLYDHLSNRKPHDSAAYGKTHGDKGFIPEVDEDQESIVLQALYMCFEPKTVLDLISEGRYNKVSVLTVAKCIMSDICAERNIPADFGQEKAVVV